MAGKYEVKISEKGTYSFNLKASNGEIIAVSQQYASLATCKRGIESVRHNAPIANIEDQTVEDFEKAVNPKFELYTDKRGETRFRLKARNGEIIATGEGYRAKASCMKGIESIRRNAPEAAIILPKED